MPLCCKWPSLRTPLDLFVGQLLLSSTDLCRTREPTQQDNVSFIAITFNRISHEAAVTSNTFSHHCRLPITKKAVSFAFPNHATSTPRSVGHVVHLVSRAFFRRRHVWNYHWWSPPPRAPRIPAIRSWSLGGSRGGIGSDSSSNGSRDWFWSSLGLAVSPAWENETQPLRHFQTFRFCDESRFHDVCVEGAAPSIMSEVHVVAAIHQRTQR